MRARLQALADRPVLVTLLFGAVFVALQMWWIARVRHVGAFGVDEEGGIATALRFHRNLDPAHPRLLIREIFNTWNGPVVPLLSVPLLIPGARTAAWVILVQPLLVVVAACSAAGIVRHFGNSRAAVLAGVVTMLSPISIVSSRSYQNSIGVSAFLGLAVWALVTSDRGRRRWRMVGMGAAAGVMVMCRTMAIGFLPGLVLAVVWVIARERRALVNVALSVLALLVVAGPWWIVNLGHIADYIWINAYGERAKYWGSVPLVERFREHWTFFLQDFHVLVVPGFVALFVVAVVAVPRLRRHPGLVRTDPAREVVALWLVVIVGFGALLSTSNAGYWFAHPLDVVLVAAAIASSVVSTTGASVRVRSTLRAMGLALAAIAVVTFGLAMAPNGAVGGPDYSPIAVQWLVPDHDIVQGDNVKVDARMGSPRESVRRRAAAEWFEASTRLADTIDGLQRRHGPVVQSIIGEIHLFNANTIGLTEELTNRGVASVEVVNTLEPPDSVLRRTLTPRAGRSIRVIVMIESRSLGLADGRRWRHYRNLAIEEGWVPDSRIPLPDGGRVVIYRHPDSIPTQTEG